MTRDSVGVRRPGSRPAVVRLRRRLRSLQARQAWYSSTASAAARIRYRLTGDHTTANWTVFRRGTSDRRIGIYALGACDLPSIFASKPLIAATLDGTCAIMKVGGVADARSDFVLQSLNRPKDESILQAVRRLRLPANTFEPRLFEPGFSIPELPQLGQFPKNATVLSIASDLTRRMYRHKEHGYLIDPGAYWLRQDLAQAAADRPTMTWVKETFTSVGTLTAEEFHSLFGKVLELLVSTGTSVIVYNMTSVNPGDFTFNYQYRRNPPAIRRMEFNDALADLVEQHGVSVLNVDRIMKKEGIHDQVDFAHFPLARIMPVATEFYRILHEREVV